MIKRPVTIGPLRVRWTRLTNDRHRFHAIAADGTEFVRELESRSLLFHDFVHFAVESEAGLWGSFYGPLARGEGEQPSAELATTEIVVGSLQSASKGDVDAGVFVGRIQTYLDQIGQTSPRWLTPAMIERILRRLRQIKGQWAAAPFGEPMELEFPGRPPA